jgi:photosystem II stability/assembly factor-like uncharacterized protein
MKLLNTVLGVALLAAVSMSGTTAALSRTVIAPGGWAVQHSGTTHPLADVACFTLTRCKAVGAAGTIRVTRNGGTTWQAQANPLAGSSASLTDITCVLPDTCYVLAAPQTILVTHNGGAIWMVRTVALSGANPSLNDIACVTSQRCYAVATPNAVYRTSDGGKTWVPQVIPPTIPCQGSCGTPNVAYPLQWVTCLSGGFCRAGGSMLIDSHAGFADAVIHVTGTGPPWTLVSNGYVPNLAICTTSSRCYGLRNSPFQPGFASVLASTNAGLSWLAPTSAAKLQWNGMACPSDKLCYIVGNQGHIAFTGTGTTFTKQINPSFRNLYAVACPGPTTCYAVGNKGAIVARK